MNESPSVIHASELAERSTWRTYKNTLRDLEALGVSDEILMEYRCKAARACFLAFAELLSDDSLKVSDFHEILASAFEDVASRKYRRLLISSPPRSGKSMLSAMFVSWLMGINGASQHIVSSYAPQLSRELERKSLEYLRHPLFSIIFPEWQGLDESVEGASKTGGHIVSAPVGGSICGYANGTLDYDGDGVGVFLVDDPLRNLDSVEELSSLESWWDTVVSTRRVNNWGQVVIGTRTDPQDLHGFLMAKDGLYDPELNPGGWRVINIQAIADEDGDILGRKDGESLWPEYLPFEPNMVNSQKLALGTKAFNALYQGTP